MPPVLIDLRTAEDPRDVVHRAVQAVVEGHLVAFPTETVYGLAVRARDGEAVERLLAVKHRAVGHPFALAVKSADEARDYVPAIGPLAWRLARRCWPGPVTLVLDGDHPDSLLGHLPQATRRAVVPAGTVGLRVPAHPTILDVLRMLTGPLVLTSANRSGEEESVTGRQVVEALGDDVDLVLDDGRCRFGRSSSVVRVWDDRFEVLREGVVPESTLRRLASRLLLFVCTGNTCRSPMAEVLCKSLVARRLGCRIDELEERGILIMSAGISAMTGSRASPEAVDVLARSGLDLSTHESQPVTRQLVQHADVIYTMTRSHRDAIVSEWPDVAERCQQISADESDISDPIGGPPEVYHRCADQLAEQLAHRVAQLDL